MSEVKNLKKPFISFVILSTIIFLMLFSIIGLSIGLGAPYYVVTSLQIISAWSSTYALLILFKRINPEISFKNFVIKQFNTKLNLVVLSLSIIIPTLVFFITAYFYPSDKTFAIKALGFGQLIIYFIYHLLWGPLGEELGWRGFALNELQKKYSPLKAAVIMGIVWGLWHFPLWLISGYTGLELLLYSILFLITLQFLSIIITCLYNLNRNLIIPIIIHQLFNYSINLIDADLLDVLKYVSLFYFLFALILTITNLKLMINGKD